MDALTSVLSPQEQIEAHLRGALLAATHTRDSFHRAVHTPATQATGARRDINAERATLEYWSGKVDAYQECMDLVRRAFVVLPLEAE